MQSGAALEMDGDDDDYDEYYDDEEEEEFEDDRVVVETETEMKQITLVAGDGAGDAGNVTETKQKTLIPGLHLPSCHEAIEKLNHVLPYIEGDVWKGDNKSIFIFHWRGQHSIDVFALVGERL